MKKTLCFILLLAFCTSLYAQTDANLGIIPAPVSIKKQAGSFVLDKTVLLVSSDAHTIHMADLLNAFIVTRAGYALREAKTAGSASKTIELTQAGAESLPAEGYKITVTDKKVSLVGKDAGLFYALQSFMQMTPEGKNETLTLPVVEINDYPRFKYRGVHLDVARHFFPLSFVKKYIDMLSVYKINTFHWHLTEDQGWRLEIKKYPKLTSVGSSRNGTIISPYPGKGNDLMEYKGFYTQDEAREVVRYAAERFITVIPEIEMPGHASAAIAAYPQLSAFPERDTYVNTNTPWSGPRKGKQVQQTWGVFDDIFVPSENTFNFLEDVLTEVMAIFPSKYIHIGGDEAPKTYWKESKFCQDLIKEKDLKDEHGLQSYFIQRIEKFLNSKGRSIIGWDEILEGGLAPNATVMSWRGTEGGIAAAKQNHDVIMTPGSMGLYIDHKQSNSPDEPRTIGGFAPYSKIYAYDPVPSELPAEQRKYILGVQANLWTEYVKTPSKAEYQLLPRLFALSEIAWTPLERKDLKNFSEDRLPVHLANLDRTSTNYWVPMPIGVVDTLKGAKHTITLKAPVAGAKIYYNTESARPRETDYLYTGPFTITVPEGETRVLQTIVITPSGRQSVTSKTILVNSAPK
jgi:hexosaminidase